MKIPMHARPCGLRTLQLRLRQGALLGALACGLAGAVSAQPAPPMPAPPGAAQPAWGRGEHAMHPGMGGGMDGGMPACMGGGMHEGMGGAMQEGMHGGMHGGMPGGMGPHMMHRMLEVMQATPAQRAQVKAILEQAHADIHAMRASSRGARGKMRALFEQPTIDAQAAEALREQMAAEHDRIGKRMLQARIAVADVFTPAQRQTLVTRMKAYHALLERQRAEREAFEMRKP